MDKSKVTIIIINWNGEHFLKNCLSSIDKNTQYSNYETIVVDNGSTDNSVNFLENNYPYVKIIKNSGNQGFARANNMAIKNTDGDYLFFLNNDTQVINGWISQSVKLAESNENIGIVGSKIYYMDMSPQYAAAKRIPLKGLKTLFPISWFLNNWVKNHDMTMETRYIQGSAFLVKRGVFDKIGLFDECFFIYGEEGDLCCRARSTGYSVMYTPDSKVKHLKAGTSKNDSFLSFFNRTKSDQRFTLLNFSIPRILLHFVLGVPIAVLNSIINHKFSLLIKAYRENIKNINEIKNKRKKRKKWLL